MIRVVGVETGGSNVQFALNRETGELVVIEMNPRVSRSSALASKATGYPIAKVATRLAVGYTLDEIPNDITGTTPASFEPTIDYVVVKAPRFAFEKFPGADGTLTTQMKSVGEAMGIGRNFCEALGKTLRSRELDGTARSDGDIRIPRWDRLDALLGRMRAGESPASLAAESGDPPVVLRRVRAHRRPRARRRRTRSRGLRSRGHAPAEAARRLRHPHRDAHRLERGRCPGTSPRARGGAGLQDGRLVRRRGRGRDLLPLLELRPRRRATRARAEARAHPRLWPEPDRPGHRVRLLLRPGRARIPASGL